MADADGAEVADVGAQTTARDDARPSASTARRRVRLTTFSAFQVVSYRWFFASSVTGVLGFQMQAVALGWLVYILTGSALYLGLITTTQAVCQTSISPLAGVIADRVERRTYIMLVRSITVVVAAILAVLVLTNRVAYPELVIAAAIMGLGFGLNGPARQALLAQLVGTDLLMNAVSLMSGGMNLMRIVGPAAAGFLIGVIGVGGIYVLLVILYAAVIIQLIPVPPQPVESRKDPKNVLGDLRDGISYSYHKPAVFGLLLFGTVPLFFAMPYVALLPIFAEQIWHAGAQGFGFLAAAPGIGGLIGALVVASLSQYRYKGRLMVACAILYGVFVSAFAVAPNFHLAALFLLLSGAASVTYSATVSSIVQTIIPNQMRGRVMSFYQMSFGVSGLSALPASAIATVIGAQETIAICGVLVVVASLAIWRIRPVIGEL
jgi:MFS family permease